jgi:hypothetical protein
MGANVFHEVHHIIGRDVAAVLLETPVRVTRVAAFSGWVGQGSIAEVRRCLEPALINAIAESEEGGDALG